MENSRIAGEPDINGGVDTIVSERSLNNLLPQDITKPGIKMTGKQCKKCRSSNTKYLETIYNTQYEFTMGDTAGLLSETTGLELHPHDPFDPRCIPPKNVYDPLFLFFVIVPLILLYLYLFSTNSSTPYLCRISSWEYLVYMGFATLSILAGLNIRTHLKGEYVKKLEEYQQTVICLECGETTF